MLLLLGAGEPIGPVIVDDEDQLVNPGWEVTHASNGRSALRCAFLSEDGSFRPEIDQEIIFRFPPEDDDEVAGPLLLFSAADDDDVEFAGYITSAEEEGLAGNVEMPIITRVEATDYNALAARRYVTATIVAGTTLKAALAVIVPYLTGITLDPDQVDGPVLPDDLVWADVKAEDALNELATITGYSWKVSTEKLARMCEPGTVLAPFNIDATTKTINKVTVKPTRDGYANRVIVRNATARKTAEDAAAIASNGPWELVVSAPDNTPDTGLQGLADSILAMSLPVLKVLKYQTLERGLRPGQTQVINLPARNVNNTFVITDVVARSGRGDMVERTVTAVEGLVIRTGWRDTYKRWNAGGGNTIAGGGSGSTSTRFAYFLGGNGIDATRSGVPTWVPASGGGALGQGAIQVQINTVVRGTTAALITARLRALDAGVSVRARLYDVTNNVACAGLSAVVTSTAWQTVTFSVTLTPGSHLYELQLLPGAADADVLGTGYLE